MQSAGYYYNGKIYLNNPEDLRKEEETIVFFFPLDTPQDKIDEYIQEIQKGQEQTKEEHPTLRLVKE